MAILLYSLNTHSKFQDVYMRLFITYVIRPVNQRCANIVCMMTGLFTVNYPQAKTC